MGGGGGCIWIIASALVLFWPWILNLTRTRTMDQDSSLTKTYKWLNGAWLNNFMTTYGHWYVAWIHFSTAWMGGSSMIQLSHFTIMDHRQVSFCAIYMNKCSNWCQNYQFINSSYVADIRIVTMSFLIQFGIECCILS